MSMWDHQFLELKVHVSLALSLLILELLFLTEAKTKATCSLDDMYCHSHIEYRRDGEGIRKTSVKWSSSIIDRKAENKNEEHVVTEDEEVSTNYCYAFNIHKPELVSLTFLKYLLICLLKYWYKLNGDMGMGTGFG
nr:probable sucrose-phosphate synthase 1 [Tanacetum cinerariifolium]